MSNPDLSAVPGDRHCPTCRYMSPVFHHLSDSELELVNKNKISVRFSPGQTIRKQGTQMTHVISVNSGLAKLYLEGDDDQNAIIRIVKPTNFIGGPGIWLDQRHHYTVTALLESVVCYIDLEIFRHLTDTNQRFAHEVLKDFSASILSVYNRLLSLTHKQMPGRLADTLLYLADEIFGSTEFELCLSRQDLSELSGMSKESANKVIRQFCREGLMELNGSHLRITEPEKMRMISRRG